MRVSTNAVEPGTQLAGYRIEGVAGEGGMGTVYLATQVALGRPVALKLISPEHGSDPAFRERFARESRLAALIDHPNVVPVYEAGEADGLLFIAMRFVPGTDLRALISRERLEPARAVEIVGQVAAALDAAHRRGLVHRDVKPANILISTEGGVEHVYLTDFGLTKRTTAQSALTEVGMFVGTLDYVAPEQIRGEATDARADVYALGCVLYHALTGAAPFDRDSDVATIQAHLNDPPPRVGRGELPASLDAVIAHALAKDPAERYPSAGDLARAAREAVQDAAPVRASSIVGAGASARVALSVAAAAPDRARRSAPDGARGRPRCGRALRDRCALGRRRAGAAGRRRADRGGDAGSGHRGRAGGRRAARGGGDDPGRARARRPGRRPRPRVRGQRGRRHPDPHRRDHRPRRRRAGRGRRQP